MLLISLNQWLSQKKNGFGKEKSIHTLIHNKRTFKCKKVAVVRVSVS